VSEPSAKAIEVADLISLLCSSLHVQYECAYHAGMPAADYVRDVHEKLAKEAKSLRAEVAELRADRERLDWLDTLTTGGVSIVGGEWAVMRHAIVNLTPYQPTVRAAIDAARAKP